MNLMKQTSTTALLSAFLGLCSVAQASPIVSGAQAINFVTTIASCVLTSSTPGTLGEYTDGTNYYLSSLPANGGTHGGVVVTANTANGCFLMFSPGTFTATAGGSTTNTTVTVSAAWGTSAANNNAFTAANITAASIPSAPTGSIGAIMANKNNGSGDAAVVDFSAALSASNGPFAPGNYVGIVNAYIYTLIN